MDFLGDKQYRRRFVCLVTLITSTNCFAGSADCRKDVTFVREMDALNEEIDEFIAWRSTKLANGQNQKLDLSLEEFQREKAKLANTQTPTETPRVAQAQQGSTITVTGRYGVADNARAARAEPDTVKVKAPDTPPAADLTALGVHHRDLLMNEGIDTAILRHSAPTGIASGPMRQKTRLDHEKAFKKFASSNKSLEAELALADATSRNLTANGVPHTVVLTGNKADAQVAIEFAGNLTDAEKAALRKPNVKLRELFDNDQYPNLKALSKTKFGRRVIIEKVKHPKLKLVASPGLLHKYKARALHFPDERMIVISNRSLSNLDLADFGMVHEKAHHRTAEKAARRDLSKGDHLDLHGRVYTADGSDLPRNPKGPQLVSTVYDGGKSFDEISRNGTDVRNYAGLMKYRLDNYGKTVPYNKPFREYSYEDLLEYSRHSAEVTISVTERALASADAFLKDASKINFPSKPFKKQNSETWYVTASINTPNGEVLIEMPLLKLDPGIKNLKASDPRVRELFVEQLTANRANAESWNSVAKASNQILDELGRIDVTTVAGREKAQKLMNALVKTNDPAFTKFPDLSAVASTQKPTVAAGSLDKKLEQIYVDEVKAPRRNPDEVASYNPNSENASARARTNKKERIVVTDGKSVREKPDVGDTLVDEGFSVHATAGKKTGGDTVNIGNPKRGVRNRESIDVKNGPLKPGQTTELLVEIGDTIPHPPALVRTKEDVLADYGIMNKTDREFRKLPAKPGNVQEPYYNTAADGQEEVIKLAVPGPHNGFTPDDIPTLEWRQIVLSEFYRKRGLPAARMYASKEEIASGLVHQEFIDGDSGSKFLTDMGFFHKKEVNGQTKISTFEPDIADAPDYHRFMNQFREGEDEIINFMRLNGISFGQKRAKSKASAAALDSNTVKESDIPTFVIKNESDGKTIPKANDDRDVVTVGGDIKPDNFIFNEVTDGTPFDPKTMFKINHKTSGEEKIYRAVLIDP